MKYWNNKIKENLTYSEAIKVGKYNFFTRPEWDGVHFICDKHYYILLNTGEIIKDPIEVLNTSDNDWMLVDCNKECAKLVKKAISNLAPIDISNILEEIRLNSENEIYEI